MSIKLSKITFEEWANNNFSAFYCAQPLRSYEIDLRDYMSNRQKGNREKFEAAIKRSRESEVQTEKNDLLMNVVKIVPSAANKTTLENSLAKCLTNIRRYEGIHQPEFTQETNTVTNSIVSPMINNQ